MECWYISVPERRKLIIARVNSLQSVAYSSKSFEVHKWVSHKIYALKMVCWSIALAIHLGCYRPPVTRPLNQAWQNFVCGATYIMIFWRLFVLSLESMNFALNVHQEIIIGETANRPLKCELTATEITGQCQINVSLWRWFNSIDPKSLKAPLVLIAAI